MVNLLLINTNYIIMMLVVKFLCVKMIWTSFSLKLHASLIKCDLAYLLCEQSTYHNNITHSKELMLELFKKLQGSALSMFTSLSAQQYYLEGGRGIEMI
jgi:hypothetical protein